MRSCSAPSRVSRVRVAIAVAPSGPLAAALVAPDADHPSTSLSVGNCGTASATARRKSPSPAFSSKSASTNLSSVIGSSRVLQVEVFQLHLSRLGPMATSTTPQPYTADRPENSTTSVDAYDRANVKCTVTVTHVACLDFRRPVGSIFRHGEDGAWRCDTAQRMRSERLQRHSGLGGECARDKDGLVERPA